MSSRLPVACRLVTIPAQLTTLSCKRQLCSVFDRSGESRSARMFVAASKFFPGQCRFTSPAIWLSNGLCLLCAPVSRGYCVTKQAQTVASRLLRQAVVPSGRLALYVREAWRASVPLSTVPLL